MSMSSLAKWNRLYIDTKIYYSAYRVRLSGFLLQLVSNRSGTTVHYLLDSCQVTAWSRTWHVAWGLLILIVTTLLSLWVLRFVKVKIKYFWFATWPLYSFVTWLCGWDSLILSHHPAKFGVHRPYGTGNNGVCNISSNSNSSAEALMPRFTNGHCPRCYFIYICFFWIDLLNIASQVNQIGWLVNWN